MLAQVRKCAEAHDIKGLRYIFADCLDVDPTFEKYREEYEYCKDMDGFFDPHQPLHGISADEKDWTAGYWEQLKLDLMKNFSERRFEHMIAVAQIVYADKVGRLLNERLKLEEENRRIEKEQEAKKAKAEAMSQVHQTVPKYSRIQEEARIAEAKRKLEEENRREEEARIAEVKRRLEEENRRTEEGRAAQKSGVFTGSQDTAGGGFGSKKALGIALAILAAGIVILIIMAVK